MKEEKDKSAYSFAFPFLISFKSLSVIVQVVLFKNSFMKFELMSNTLEQFGQTAKYEVFSFFKSKAAMPISVFSKRRSLTFFWQTGHETGFALKQSFVKSFSKVLMLIILNKPKFF